MWIFCCGPKRSGSTLQFNIVRELIERKSAGVILEYSFPDEFPLLYSKYKNVDGFKVFKSHELTDFMFEILSNNEAYAISCYRDLRDVIVSIAKKEGYSSNYIAKKKLMVRDYIQYYKKVKALKNSYLAKYEDFYENINVECKSIASFLGITVSDSNAMEIGEKLTYRNKDNLVKEKNVISFEAREEKKYELDKTTLIHKNHFGNIHPSSYKNDLSKAAIAYVESEGALWLIKHGYHVSFKGFLSYLLNLVKSINST